MWTAASAMSTDAGIRSKKQEIGTNMALMGSLAYPVIAVVCLILMWVLYFMQWHDWVNWVLMIPLVDVVVVIFGTALIFMSYE